MALRRKSPKTGMLGMGAKRAKIDYSEDSLATGGVGLSSLLSYGKKQRSGDAGFPGRELRLPGFGSNGSLRI